MYFMYIICIGSKYIFVFNALLLCNKYESYITNMLYYTFSKVVPI